MTLNLMAGRANPVPERPEEYVSLRLQAIADAFDLSWLAQQNGNFALQKLWRRDDPLSTAQLLLFGEGILTFRTQHPRWVSSRVRAIKKRSSDQRVGDAFELAGAAMLTGNDQSVIPAKEDQRGFDLIVNLRNGAKLYVSMKSHEGSRVEEEFWSHGEAFRQDLIQQLAISRLNGIGLMASCSVYPGKAEWGELKPAIVTMLGLQNSTRMSFQSCHHGFWKTELISVPTGSGSLASSPLSYMAILATPAAKNDQPNLFSSLSSAAHNFETHYEETIGPANYRGILIKLPQSSSMTECAAWCRHYFNQQPSSLDFIALYQITTASLEIGAPYGLMHSLIELRRPGFAGFAGLDGIAEKLHIRPIIGMVSREPTKFQLVGSSSQLPQVGYLYQQGDVYRSALTTPSGEISGEMNSPAPGVRNHSVFQMPGQSGSLLISGKYATSDRITLFS